MHVECRYFFDCKSAELLTEAMTAPCIVFGSRFAYCLDRTQLCFACMHRRQRIKCNAFVLFAESCMLRDRLCCLHHVIRATFITWETESVSFHAFTFTFEAHMSECMQLFNCEFI